MPRTCERTLQRWKLNPEQEDQRQGPTGRSLKSITGEEKRIPERKPICHENFMTRITLEFGDVRNLVAYPSPIGRNEV